MKFETKDYNSYTINLCNIKKFKTIELWLNIKTPIKKEEITIRKILFSVLFHSTQEYSSPKEISIKLEDLYSSYITESVYREGKFLLTEVLLSCLEDKYTEENNFEEAIKLLSEILFNPKIENESFDEKIVNLYKERLKTSIENIKEVPARYAHTRGLEEHDKNSITSYRMIGYIEDLDNIDGKTLYKYYKKIIKTNLFDFYVIGNITFNKLSPIIKKYFNKIDIISRKNTNVFLNDKIIKKAKTTKESIAFEQSILKMYFKFDKVTKHERLFYIKILSLILGNVPGLLFDKVREKHSLCYSISGRYSYYDNILCITTNISKENYEKVRKLINETIKDITKQKFSNEILEDKKNLAINFYENLDSSSQNLKSYMVETYTLELMDKDEIIKNIKKITKNDIVKVAKKIKLESVYFLEGVKDEKA